MPITFPMAPLTVVVEIALGVDPSSDPAGWSWTDITAFVRYAPGIQIVKGRRDESSRVDSQTARLTLDNRDGRFCRRNPLSPYYGQLSKNTPIRIGVDAGDGVVRYRFHGFVNEWPGQWSPDGVDSTVPITCAGILRRLVRNRRLGSPLFRTMIGVAANDYSPVGYWSLEDGSDASQFASAIGGAAVAVPTGVTPAADSSMAGSAPVPTFNTAAQLTIPMPAYPGTDRWFVEFFVKIPARPGSLTTYASIPVTGSPVGRIDLAIDGSSAPYPWRMRAFDPAGAFMSEVSILIPDSDPIPSSAVYGGWAAVVMGIRPSSTPGNYVVWGHVGVPGYPDIGGGGPGGTGSVGRPSSVTIHGTGGISAGHVGLFADPAFNPLTDSQANVEAVAGYAGELAHVRMTRVCREEGVSFTTAATTSAAMGVQPSGTLLDLLRECEAADQGILYENQFGLGYLSLAERYNRTSAMDLDALAGQIAPGLERADDDQQTLNRFTASRPGGSSATVEDTTSIDTDGLYASSGTFNVEGDDQLADIASWNVHRGTVDEDRWPSVGINLARSPELITAWTGLQIGDAITVANVPTGSIDNTV